MNDLIAIENWLETAEDRQSGWSSPARDMAKLEVMIQSHREFLMEMIKHKPTILSLNMLTQKFLSSSHGDEAEGLHLRIKALNKKWESVCQAATSWQNELQKALLQCSEFRNTLQELIMWLESSEERIHHMGSTEAISDNNLISIQYNKYLELKRELERCKPRIMTFQQTADSLFTPSVVSSAFGAEAAEGDTAEIHEQLENANQRLQALMGKCNTEIERLHRLLQFEEDKNYLEEQYARADVQHGEVRIASEEDLERSQINHCYRYLTRVAKASLPIQGLMLLLLGIASLVPMSEDDFSCVLTNNFARSFEPMLQYPDGPPPV